MNARFLKDTPRLINGLTGVIFALMVFVFFGYFYPHHLHYQEQFQLFQLTADYACQQLSVPGGLADYLGGFLTQFYVNSRFGAAIIALLLLGIQQFTARRLRHRSCLTYAHSYLPAWGMLYYLLDEHAMLSAPVALLVSLIVADGLDRLRGNRLRHVLTLVCIPITYILLGGLAVVFVAAMAVEEVRRGWTPRSTATFLLALLLAVACPLVAQYVWPYSWALLARGIHYYRYPAMRPTMVWASALLALVSMGLGLVLKPRDLVLKPRGEGGRISWVGRGLQTIYILIITFLISHYGAQLDKERVMAYDFLTRYQQWDRVVALATEQSPTWKVDVTCLNLALGMTGTLADYQFRFFQYGTEGLFPQFAREFTTPLVTAEVFYQLGFINTAQRYTFEAQEALPDAQKSARCYQRLAETALINGDYSIARKYLQPLLHTMFYREWAQNLWQLTQDDKAVEAHPVYGRLRRLRTPEDYLFSDLEMDSMIGRLFMCNKENKLAFEYLLSYQLLHRNLSRFYECYPLGRDLGYDHIPRAYQEALVLIWTQHHTDFKGMPWSINPRICQSMAAFIRDFRAGRPAEYMKQQYAGTYWLYFIQQTKERTVE